MLEHWKTLQEGWVNAFDTLYDLFLILDNLLCNGESLNKYNTFSELRITEHYSLFMNRTLFIIIYHIIQIKRISLTEKFLICLINKFFEISQTQSK